MNRKRLFHYILLLPIWGQGLRKTMKTRWKGRKVCALPQFEQGTSRTQIRSVPNFPESSRIYIDIICQMHHIYIWPYAKCQDVDTAEWSFTTALCHVHSSGHDGWHEDHDFWRMWWSSPSTSWFRSFDPFRLSKLIVKFPNLLRSSENPFLSYFIIPFL